MSTQGTPYDAPQPYFPTPTSQQNPPSASSQPWSYDTPQNNTNLQINPDAPQLQMHFSHSSHQPSQSTTPMGSSNYMIAGMPQPYSNPSIIIAGLPTNSHNHTPISTPTNHSTQQPWELTHQYAPFPSISEHPQLAQVNSYHAPLTNVESAPMTQFPWIIPAQQHASPIPIQQQSQGRSSNNTQIDSNNTPNGGHGGANLDSAVGVSHIAIDLNSTSNIHNTPPSTPSAHHQRSISQPYPNLTPAQSTYSTYSTSTTNANFGILHPFQSVDAPNVHSNTPEHTAASATNQQGQLNSTPNSNQTPLHSTHQSRHNSPGQVQNQNNGNIAGTPHHYHNTYEPWNQPYSNRNEQSASNSNQNNDSYDHSGVPRLHYQASGISGQYDLSNTTPGNPNNRGPLDIDDEYHKGASFHDNSGQNGNYYPQGPSFMFAHMFPTPPPPSQPPSNSGNGYQNDTTVSQQQQPFLSPTPSHHNSMPQHNTMPPYDSNTMPGYATHPHHPPPPPPHHHQPRPPSVHHSTTNSVSSRQGLQLTSSPSSNHLHNSHHNNNNNQQFNPTTPQHYNQNQTYPPMSLREIIAENLLPAMCSSQHGARSLQAELDYNNSNNKQPQLIQEAFQQLLPYIFRLSVHPFANYVVQKLIDSLPNANDITASSNPNGSKNKNNDRHVQSNQVDNVIDFLPLLPPTRLFTPFAEWNEEMQQLYDQEQLSSITAGTPNRNEIQTQSSPHPHNSNNNATTLQPWSGLSTSVPPPPLPCEPEISPQYYCLLMLRAFNFGAGLHSLCTDPFGCRVIQKILDVFASSNCSSNSPHNRQYRKNNHYHSQKGFNGQPMSKSTQETNNSVYSHDNLHPILSEAYGVIYHHIAPHFFTFSVHQHANHVIQKCIETIPGFLKHPIFIPLFYPKVHQYALLKKFKLFEEEKGAQYSLLTDGTLPQLPMTDHQDDEKRNLKNGAKKSKKGDNACGTGNSNVIYHYTQDSILLGSFTPESLPIISSITQNDPDGTEKEISSGNEKCNEKSNSASYAIFYDAKIVQSHTDPLLNSTFTSYATTPAAHRDLLDRLTRMMGPQQREALHRERERLNQYQAELKIQHLHQQYNASIQNTQQESQLSGLSPVNPPSAYTHDDIAQPMSPTTRSAVLNTIGLSSNLDQNQVCSIVYFREQYGIDIADIIVGDDDDDDNDDEDNVVDLTLLPTNLVDAKKYKKALMKFIYARDELYGCHFPYIFQSSLNNANNKKILFHQLFATNLRDGYHMNPFTSLSTHTYGCRVIQRIYSYCEDQTQRGLLLQLITESFLPLVQDLFGNYVIQHTLGSGSLYDIQHITSLLRGNVLSFAMNKCSSNVVEKALQCGNAMVVEGIIQELLTPPNGIAYSSKTSILKGNGLQPHDLDTPIVAMIAHPFANYVVQTILSVCLHEQKNSIIALIKRVAGHIELNEFSKKILFRVDPRYNDRDTRDSTPNSRDHHNNRDHFHGSNNGPNHNNHHHNNGRNHDRDNNNPRNNAENHNENYRYNNNNNNRPLNHGSNIMQNSHHRGNNNPNRGYQQNANNRQQRDDRFSQPSPNNNNNGRNNMVNNVNLQDYNYTRRSDGGNQNNQNNQNMRPHNNYNP